MKYDFKTNQENRLFMRIKQKSYEPLTDTIENNSENLTKSMMEPSFTNNEALENLNNKLLKLMNDRGIIACYLMSPLSKIPNP